MEVEEAISRRRSETVAESARVRTGVPEGARSFKRMVAAGRVVMGLMRVDSRVRFLG